LGAECAAALCALALSVGGARADGRAPVAFAYRSFWPEFGAMAQFRDAGVDTVCIFAANTDNSLGKPYCTYPPVWRWFGKYDFGSLDKQYDDVLAVNSNKTPGVSTIARDGWTAVYAGSYDALTPQALRRAAVGAGVTIYCEDAVPVFANERLVAVHMAEGGEKTVTLPKACREVRELFTGRVVPVVEKKFRYTFASPDTALFELVK